MKLLLTVARPPEVRVALCAGADLVDVKDPSRGSLGRPSGALLGEVTRRCAGRRPVGLPLGDGPHDPAEVGRAADRALRFGPAYLKVGMAGEGDTDRIGRSLAAVARRIGGQGHPVRLVAVTFADAAADEAPTPEDAVQVAHARGADLVMLDTLSKGAASTLELLGRSRLRRWAAAAAARGLGTAVAGGLDEGSIPALAGLGIDVVGVRGGACVGGRRGRLDPERCRALRRAVDAAARPAAPAG